VTAGKEVKGAPKTWLGKQLSHIKTPERLVGSKYVDELASRECPYCQYLLPYNIETTTSKSIVVVGDTYSGKSHFIAAIIRQIQDGDIPNPDQYARFVCLTDDVMKTYTEHYLNTLFKKKQQLDLTSPATDIKPTEPLIYELVIKKSPRHPPKRVNLIFYDASGEDYAERERLVRYSRYVLNASAIIFLADPVSMPNIFDRLPAHLQHQPSTGRRASDVLNSMIQLFERSKGIEAGSRLLSVPIAVALSKSDLLKYLTGINHQYSFSSHPKQGYGNGIDLDDLRTVDREVREVIYEYGDRTLLHSTTTLNTQFFATSATGIAPKDDGTYASVEPRRCLDPVLWVLYKLGILEAR
jgi:GTPase SAR1 family protein